MKYVVIIKYFGVRKKNRFTVETVQSGLDVILGSFFVYATIILFRGKFLIYTKYLSQKRIEYYDFSENLVVNAESVLVRAFLEKDFLGREKEQEKQLEENKERAEQHMEQETKEERKEFKPIVKKEVDGNGYLKISVYILA